MSHVVVPEMINLGGFYSEMRCEELKLSSKLLLNILSNTTIHETQFQFYLDCGACAHYLL